MESAPASAAIDAIMAVMERGFDPAFGEAWNRRQVEGALSMPGTFGALISADGTVTRAGLMDFAPNMPAGFTLSRHVVDEEELLLIAVVPDERGRGLGARLINRLAQEAEARGATRLFLEMREDNPARRLYSRLQFKAVGRRPGYYRGRDGITRDAITFARSLISTPEAADDRSMVPEVGQKLTNRGGN